MTLRKIYLGLFVLLGWACQSEKEPAPNNCDEKPQIMLVSTKDVSGCVASDGAITVSGSGGAGGLMYSLNGGSFQTSGEFENIAPGTYSVTVQDAAGCSSELEAAVNIPDSDLSFTVETTIDDECLSNTGSIKISAAGGEGPYSFSIDDTFGSSTEFLSLSGGSYTVMVKDALGCTVSSNVNVPRGDTGVSYMSDIDAIVKSKCAISGCHNGNNSLPDFNVFSNFQSRASMVKSRTQSRDMPRTGSLTQDQIDLIACWVDDGAKTN